MSSSRCWTFPVPDQVADFQEAGDPSKSVQLHP